MIYERSKHVINHLIVKDSISAYAEAKTPSAKANKTCLQPSLIAWALERPGGIGIAGVATTDLMFPQQHTDDQG